MKKSEIIKHLNSNIVEDKSFDNPLSMSFQVSSKISSPASTGFRKFYRMMKNLGYTDDELKDVICDMEFHTNEEVSEHLRGLFKERKLSPSSIGKSSLISERYLRQVVNNNKHLSKYTLLALCLYMELSEEEAQKFMDVAGVSLSDSIPDVMFRTFIKKRVYRLGDYVEACKLLAEETGVELEQFFHKIYSNDTYRD